MNEARRGKGSQSGTGGASSVEVVLVVAVILLTVIVLGGWVALAGKTNSLEGKFASAQRDKSKLAQLSTRVDGLSDRLEAAEEDRLETRKLAGRVADLSRDVARLRDDDSRRKLADDVAEIRDSLDSLKRTLALVQGIAESAAKTPVPAAVSASPDGPSAEEMAELAKIMNGLSERLAAVEKRPAASKGSTPRLNEAAVRQLIEKMVGEELDKSLPEEIQKVLRDLRNRRRPPGGGGGGG